jgi:hypothetical protein
LQIWIEPTDVLAMIMKMAPVMGDKHEALHLAEPMTRMFSIMSSSLPETTAKQFHQQIIDFVRSAELSANVLDPKHFVSYLDNVTRAIIAFQGTVTPHDFFMATRQGRASALNWSDRFLGTVVPTLIQEIGAPQAGTALMTMYQAMIGGRMTLRALNWWDELGLIAAWTPCVRCTTAPRARTSTRT